MASLLTSTTPSPTLPSPSSGGFSSPLSSPRPSNASPAGLPSRLPSTSTRSRTASRRGTNPISVSLAKGLLANQAAQTLTSPVVVEGEQGPPAVLLAPDAPPADRFATWGNFGRPWDVDSPSSSRRSSLAAGDSSGGRSSRRQSRSRRSMASSDGGPLDPPFTEGDVLTPYQSLPASASSAPLLPVRSPAASHFGGSTESNTASPEGTVDGEAASSSASGEADIRSLEIVRKLGVGSYAVVYLVREVIADKDSPSSDDDLFDGLDGDDVAAGARRHRVYGREFALKCLSKQDLSEESLDVQMFEATIHQSIPSHPNIVTLYQTFQTSEWLFLVMELCPGEDLFYWLEHSKPPSTDGKLPTPFQHAVAMTPVKQQMHQLMGNTPPSLLAGSGPHHNNPAPHHGSAPHVSHLSNHLMSALAITPQNKTHGTPSNSFLHSTLHSTNVSAAYTPPTPSLLSAVPAPLLLSPSRVRLIASMFAQMCAAVQACHDAGVSHRDIKPENVIVTEEKSWRKSRGKVVCKLTDFGLATRDEESEDVECGSRPYMAVECRNNLGPSYRPPPADVWSLGIVLINMLFHKNPWSDPAPTCAPFQSFRADPKGFLAAKFPGMGEEVATYLAERVLAWDPEDRVTAGEFGKWVGSLITMLGGSRKGPGVFLNGGIGGKQAFKGGVLQFGKKDVQRKDSGSPTGKLEEGLVFAKSPVLARRSLVPIEGSDGGSVPSSPSRPLSTLTNSAPSPQLADTKPVPLATALSNGSTPHVLLSPRPMSPHHASKMEGFFPSPKLANATPVPLAVPAAPLPATPSTGSPSASPTTPDAPVDLGFPLAVSPKEAPAAPPTVTQGFHIAPVTEPSIAVGQSAGFDTDGGETNEESESCSRSTSIASAKRKKRGVRKGKAAQAAAAAADGGSGMMSGTVSPLPAAYDALAPAAAAGEIAFSLGVGSRETTSRALALASQTLAREISAMANPRPSVCLAPSGYPNRGGGGGGALGPHYASPSLSSTSSSATVGGAGGSCTSTPALEKQSRSASATRRAADLEILNALARERIAALDKTRGRSVERNGEQQLPSTSSSIRRLSPTNSNHSSINSNRSASSYQSYGSSASYQHQHSNSDTAASWRTTQTTQPSLPLPTPLPGSSHSAPAVPTTRDAGSGGVPGQRRVLVPRRSAESAAKAADADAASSLRRANDPSPGGLSNRTSASASSPASSLYSRASGSTYATSASDGSVASYQHSSRGSSMYSGGAQPSGAGQPPKRQTNVKQLDGIPYQLDQLPRHNHFTRSGEFSTSDHIFEPPRPPKVKQPKPATKQKQAYVAPTVGLDTITEKPKIAVQAPMMATAGTGGGDHRSVHSGRSITLGAEYPAAPGLPQPSKYRDASTGAASPSGSSSTARVLTPRQYSGFERSSSPSASVQSGESGGRLAARTPLNPSSPAPTSAPVEKERPVKLKGQISTLRSMLGGLKGKKAAE